MSAAVILANSLWAALFGTGMAVLFSAPARALIPSFCCAFLARFLRDALLGWGAGANLATFVAAGIVSIVAFGVISRRRLSPVVVAAGLIPLGAAAALFRAINAFLGAHYVVGKALTDSGAAVEIFSNLRILFLTTCAIAAGVWVGYLVWQFIRRDEFA